MNIIEEVLLVESRMSDAKKKFGNLNMYDWQLLDKLDPSDNHKYLMWLAREYDKGPKSDAFSPKVKETLNHFHRYPEKYNERDINQYNSLKDLVKASQEAQQNISKREQKRTGAKKVYEDDSYLVVVPTTHEASCFYGAGTKWCTASSDRDGHFNNYSRKGMLLYILNKNLPETDPLYKVALYKAYSGGKELYYDATDQEISDIKAALTPDLERTTQVTYDVMKGAWSEARKGHNYGDPRVEALVQMLNLTDEEVDDIVEEEYAHYGIPSFQYGDEEYAVATDSEADEAHYEYVENLIDDIGYDGFGQSIDWYVDGDDVAEDWRSSIEEWVYDDPESYLDEDDKQYFDQDIFDNLVEKQEELKEYEERVKKLYDNDSTSWARDEKKIEQLEGEAEEVEIEIEELESNLEDSRDWSDEQKEDYIESYLQDIKDDPVNYLKNMGYGDEEMERYIDREAFIQGVVDEGYRGENLSSYDGEEHEEQTEDGTWYYIYRTN
jgi:hypothetical protein